MVEKLYFNQNAVKYRYECERMMRSYLLPQKLEMVDNTAPTGEHYVEFKSDGKTATVTVNDGGVFIEAAEIDDISEEENILCALLLNCMKKCCGKAPEWGILTGVRPVKYIRNLYSEMGDKADSYILNRLCVSQKKLSLAKLINSVQQPIIDTLTPEKISLYISIPFCPTRCSYCSFVCEAVNSALKQTDSYFELLLTELDLYKQIVNRFSLTVDTVYIGGGTPTILGEDKLSRLMSEIHKFDLSQMREFTVEAGRPDTITSEKLKVIKSGGAKRISVNPQSMNDNVLQTVGRRHTVDDVYRAFEAARKVGFDCINSDIIAGLPAETPESFSASLERLIALAPENITVHTLSLKRSGTLYRNFSSDIGKYTAEMVNTAANMMSNSGYIPYYMYRQKNAAESLENVGYSKKGYYSLYNIFIMEELQTILAAGCAGSTKLVGDNIKRVINCKYPFEYVRDFDKVKASKQEIEDFFKSINTERK